MRRGFLVLESDGEEGRRTPLKDSLVIGRTSDCDVVIHDSAASRRHVKVFTRGDSFFWKDLGSTNGTLINGRAMLEGELHPGDVIGIGATVVRFEVEEDSGDKREKAGTPLFVETILDDSGAARKGPDPGKTAELLHAIYAVMNTIGSNYDPCSLVDQILETTMQAIRAQRGAVFFATEDEPELKPCNVCGHVHVIEDGKLRHAQPGEIQISQTVAQRVLMDGESVLFQNTAGSDGELAMSESIMTLRLRSIICVPLRGKSGVFGILYVDTDRSAHQYTHEDMLLSTAVGNSAGLAIENARMHREILEKQRIEQEIEYAWIIQEGFLVKDWPEDAQGFAVYGETRPAKTVGGDFYDYVQPWPGCVGILIGDVSGKGVPAALLMAQLLAVFRLYARDMLSPADLIAALNADLVVRSQRGMFCTLCYITLDLASGVLRCANAGHPPPLHIHAPEAELFGNASGPPVGIVEGAVWQDVELAISPGDTVLLYTDGIAEARRVARRRNEEGLDSPDEYGIESLRVSASSVAGETPRALVERIQADVRRHCEPLTPHDDCTMIALRYLEKA
ncbi:MAG: Serine phosphatase RsbU [Candidatus Hydrogenedentes bacterium]|nr:Serine phosphatase RsbU [Candidatus Hydrogenedentota bacterium]